MPNTFTSNACVPVLLAAHTAFPPARRASDSSVVHQDVHRAEPLDGGIEQRIGGRLIGDVGLNRNRLPPYSLDLFRDRFGGIDNDLTKDDVRAARRQLQGDASADTVAAASDDGYFPVDFHCFAFDALLARL